MKRVWALLVIITLIIFLAGCSNNSNNEETPEIKDSFGIYLATTDSVRDYGYYDFENLQLQDKPVLTGEDIRLYHWPDHVIDLSGTFIENLINNDISDRSEYNIDDNGFRSYEKGGSMFLDSAQYMAFVVVVNGGKVYSGTFPGSQVMPVIDEALVLGDISDNRLQLKFFGDQFDIRNSDPVYEYFSNAGKLSDEPINDTSSIIEDLTDKLAKATIDYNNLLTKYNDLKNDGNGNVSGDKRLEALIKWQEARLDLYIIETQEGEKYSQFSDLIGTLDPSRPDSMRIASDYFWQSAGSDYYINDRMFNVLEEFYNVVISSIPENYSMAEIDDSFIANARSAGINVSIEKGFIEASPIPSYLRGNFELFLSDILNEYLILRDKELALLKEYNSNRLMDDEELFVEIDQVADLIYDWKSFSDNYPNNYPFNIKARLRAEELLSVYIGATEFAVSPLYDSESMELKPEAKNSYMRFISEYRDSAYYPIIADLFIVLEGSGFKLDSDVSSFIKSIDFSQYGF